VFDLFKRLKDGLVKTRLTLTAGIRSVLSGFRPIDDELFEELEEVLIGADVGVVTTEKLLKNLKERVRQAGITDSSGVEALLREEIAGLLARGAFGAPTPARSDSKPLVVVVMGANGVGKTTTIGKLAHAYKAQGKRVLIAAADTFRAAATDQLAIWAERAGSDIVRGAAGSDPAAVAFDGLKAAQARAADVLIVDTAGRLQTKVNLMEELKKIGRVLSRQSPGAPHEALLVLDASTGQNAIAQAREFGDALELTGLVLTKVDGTAKGGVVIAIADQLGTPVRFLGTGERIEDLSAFDPRQFTAALFDRASDA
jgi:fused signal recognition particle receptor